jgi:Ca-activated chloride channel family protein
MVFKDPWVLLFIPVLFILIYFIKRYQKEPTFTFPSKTLLSGLIPSWKIRFQFLPNLIRYIVIVLFLIALAGPRFVRKESVRKTEGIDIVLAIDASGSMAAEDFMIKNERMNRLAIIKKVVKEFIDNRTNDRIGLVAFGGVAYTVCPLTTDHNWLDKNLDRVELGLIEDGTAIGSAIASSVNRLKNSTAKSKIIVLLTDGMENIKKVDPLTAAQAAKTLGIKIYTIGAGSKGFVPFPAQDFFGRKVYQNVLIDLDEDMMKKIADITYGKYFRATDTESLRQVYKEIDQLEKVKIEELGYFEYDELFNKVLAVALVLLLVEIILSNSLLLKVP